MYLKEYGNTGIKVSAIGFGAMRFDNEDVKEKRFEKCADLILYAWDKGINYWDTAPFYCDDKSETIVGMAVEQAKRDEIYLSTKTNFGTIGEKHDRANFRRRLETSLERLQTDYIDFYQLWCLLNMESYEKHMEEIYRFFEEAKAEGLIRNIAFSSHMEGNVIEKVIESDKFKGMLIGYNPLNYRFRQSGIESAYQKGMGVVAMNPVGGGLIPDQPEMFSYLTKGTDLNVAQASLRFVASHKEITIALNGFTTKEQVDEAVKAVENLEEKPAKEVIAGYSEGVSLNNLCTGCGYCKVCPVDITIPEYMDAYNMKLLTGKMQECANRLKWQWGIRKEDAGKCIACKNCEEACTQHLPIIERLDKIAKMTEVAS
jgi:predicted aldo/keto reductase-like oxidoreductase